MTLRYPYNSAKSNFFHHAVTNNTGYVKTIKVFLLPPSWAFSLDRIVIDFDYIKCLFQKHFFLAFINIISELLKTGCWSSSGTYDTSKCSSNKFKNIFQVFFCFSVSLSSWHIIITVFGVVNSIIVFTNASTTFKKK